MWSIHIWLGLGWLASNGGGRFWLSGGLWCGLLTMDRPSVEQKTQLAQKCNEWAELVIWNINRVKQRIFVNHNLTEPGGNTYYMVMSRPAATKNSLCFSCYDKWSVRDVYTVETKLGIIVICRVWLIVPSLMSLVTSVLLLVLTKSKVRKKTCAHCPLHFAIKFYNKVSVLRHSSGYLTRHGRRLSLVDSRRPVRPQRRQTSLKIPFLTHLDQQIYAMEWNTFFFFQHHNRKSSHVNQCVNVHDRNSIPV